MSKAQAVLSVEHITKKFVGTVALRDVSLQLFHKEILAVMGENGAGKSTLMKILSGLYPENEYEGEIRIDGKKCRFSSPMDSEDAGIAMIYQELNLELDLSVAENIMLGRLPRKKIGLIDWEKTKSMARSALEKLQLDLDVTVTVRNLSPSVQQLVSIARAIVRDPRILILDEPTSVLTESETTKLMGILRTLRDKGISCIYISHKLDEVFELCDRMVILRDGEYMGEHRKEEGYDSGVIIEEMIGRKLSNMYPNPGDRRIGGEALRVENFCVPHTFAYGKNIIEDVSFNLRKGEILGLAGLVGSGRSELVNALFGTIPKKSGTIHIDGKEVKITSPQDAKALGIGLMTEDRKKNGFIGTMSVCHNMTLTILKKIKKHILVDKRKERRLAGEYFERLRVKAPSMDVMITNLSGGNQQKTILAKWLMTDLKIIILDEPTRGIDVGTKAEIYKLIYDLAAKGISIIMISSEMPELLAMCDRFVVLGKGRVLKTLKKEEATEVSILKIASST